MISISVLTKSSGVDRLRFYRSLSQFSHPEGPTRKSKMMEYHEQQQEEQQSMQQADQQAMQWAPPFDEAFGTEQITSAAILEEKERMEAWYETWKQTLCDKDEEIIRIKANVELHQAQVRAAEAEKVALDVILASEIEGRKQTAAKMQELQRQIDVVVDDQETLAEVTRRMERIRQTADVQDEARNNALEVLLGQIEEIRLEYADELAEIEDEIKAKQHQALNHQDVLSALLAELAEKKKRSADAGREATELEEACKKLEKEYTELRTNNETERQKLAAKAAEMQKTELELAEAFARNALLKKEVANAEVQRGEAQARHNQARAEFDFLEAEHRKMVEENTAFIIALEAQLANSEQEELDLDEHTANLEGVEQKLLRDLEAEKMHREELAAELAEKTRAVEQEATQITELNTSILTEEARLKDLEEKQSSRKGAFDEEIASLKAQGEASRQAIQRAEEQIAQEEAELRQATLREGEYARLEQELRELEEAASKSAELTAKLAAEREETDRLQNQLKAKKEELATKKKTDQKEAKAHDTANRQLEQAKDNLTALKDLLAQALGRDLDFDDVGEAIDEFAANYERSVKQLKEYSAQIEKETKQNSVLENELEVLDDKVRQAEELKATLEAARDNKEEETQERPRSQPTQGTQESRMTSMAPPASKPEQTYAPSAKRSRQERAYSVDSSESEYIDASLRGSSVNSVVQRAAALGISRQSRLPVAGTPAIRRGVSRSQDILSQEPMTIITARSSSRGRGRAAARGGAARAASRTKNKLDFL
ncbi:hypothetical protein RvY_07136 [Ramazzottius varieornatus]|uniref:Uncharacterized protein n=1 Tax=Ramazzottius varieornatus TaxID=947166 RepID=A0A1D1V498_RAMVA|nr:hypothetical protein RvY_07136 [Ramazzottius varieornatus]